MKEKIEKFFAKNWILKWVIGSVAFALLIHVLFKMKAPFNFFEATWEPGEILEYVGTVSLGLLALWQNKKLQDENEKYQIRLEEISQKANELEIIGKIIDDQSGRIAQQEDTFQVFMDSCDISRLLLDISNTKSIDEATRVILNFQMNRKDNTNKIIRLLDYDECKQDTSELKKAVSNFSDFVDTTINSLGTNSFFHSLRKEGDEELTDEELFKGYLSQVSLWYVLNGGNQIKDVTDKLIQERDAYLVLKKGKLQKLLYENMSLREVREFLS